MPSLRAEDRGGGMNNIQGARALRLAVVKNVYLQGHITRDEALKLLNAPLNTNDPKSMRYDDRDKIDWGVGQLREWMNEKQDTEYTRLEEYKKQIEAKQLDKLTKPFRDRIAELESALAYDRQHAEEAIKQLDQLRQVLQTERDEKHSLETQLAIANSSPSALQKQLEGGKRALQKALEELAAEREKHRPHKYPDEIPEDGKFYFVAALDPLQGPYGTYAMYSTDDERECWINSNGFVDNVTTWWETPDLPEEKCTP